VTSQSQSESVEPAVVNGVNVRLPGLGVMLSWDSNQILDEDAHVEGYPDGTVLWYKNQYMYLT